MEQNGKPRLRIKHMILILISNPEPLTGSKSVSPTLRDIQNGLAYWFGRNTPRRYIRNQLRELERQGVIETISTYLKAGNQGPQAQANVYRIVDLAKGFDLELTERQEQIREKAREKREEPPARLRVKFYLKHWKPSPAYVEGYARYDEALQRVNFGPPYPKGDPRNMDKVKRANEALVREKRERDTKSSQPQDTPDHRPAKSA